MSKRNLGFVYRCTFVAAVGGLLFGYDTAVIAGAIGFIEQKYHLSPAMVGWVASCALIGCVIGAMFGGSLSDKIGRKKVLMLSGLMFAISSVGIMLPLGLDYFILFRLIGGVGIGVASMLSPMYISEIAPADIRGRLVSINQLGIVSGILLIYFVNARIATLYDTAWNIETGWRWMFGSGCIPSFLFIILLFIVPESPRWLAQKGRWDKASVVLNKINGPQRTEMEIAAIRSSLMGEKGRFSELLQPGLRKAAVIGVILAIFSQVTGINAIMYYAPEIFKANGSGTDAALMQTVLVGIINLAFTIVAIKYVDRLGRKKLLLIGAAGMAICLLLVGAAFHFGLTKGYLLLLSILGYISFFAVSLGPLTFVVIAEIFPTRIRGKAVSLSIFFLWVAVFAVSQSFPILLKSIGNEYTFWLFMVLSIAAFFFISKMVPETKGKSLEEIENYWSQRPLMQKPKLSDTLQD